MQQQTTEWIEMRKGKIGASDAPIIMGLSPWRTPEELWAEKVGLIDPPLQTAVMKRGLEMEPIAREAFEKTVGFDVLPEVRFHKSLRWMIASMDGVSLDGTVAVEIKCPSRKDDHLTAMEGIVPEKYIPQLQHQMCVCDLEKIYYFSFFQQSQALILINRDQEFIDKMIQKEKEFYDCVQEMRSPRKD